MRTVFEIFLVVLLVVAGVLNFRSRQDSIRVQKITGYLVEGTRDQIILSLSRETWFGELKPAMDRFLRV